MLCGESGDPGNLEKMKESPEAIFLGITQVKGQVRAHGVWKEDQNIQGLRFPADLVPSRVNLRCYSWGLGTISWCSPGVKNIDSARLIQSRVCYILAR